MTQIACQDAATLKLAKSLDPDAVLILGDLQYEKGAAADFKKSFEKSWGQLRSITRTVPGNHEYKTADATGYFKSVDAADPWYAFDAGRWRIYMLNTNCDDVDCDAQKQWLISDIAKNPRLCSAMATHHPRYSSGPHNSDPELANLWQIAYDKRIDLALSAHDHTYERFQPMNGNDAIKPGRGVTSFVSGTGGKSLYKMRRLQDGSAYFDNAQFGVLHLSLGASEFSWEFRDIDGGTQDQGTSPCV